MIAWMRPNRSLACAALVALLCACSGRSSVGPEGWTKVSANSTTWTLGEGSTQQIYRLERAPFTGSLAALGARQTIAVVLGGHGVRLRSTVPFPACPGAAGVATFSSGAQIIESAYAVLDGNAVTIRYERPKSFAESPAVQAAMQRTLCAPPA